MISYDGTPDLEGMDTWGKPEDVGAKTIEGQPELFGRVDFGSFDTPIMGGVYRATRGKFEVEYPFHEHACLVRGDLALTDSSGVTRNFGPGDSWIVAKGETIIWDVGSEDIVKTFVVSTTDLD